MSTKISSKTIVVDLDNTLADYSGGYEANKDFPGEPRKDVLSGLLTLKQSGFIIGIYSTRNTALVKQWVKRWRLEKVIDFVNEHPDQPDGCSYKPIAHCYIDDRAIRYNGTNMQAIVDMILSGASDRWKEAKP
jgi:hypothetical protein